VRIKTDQGLTGIGESGTWGHLETSAANAPARGWLGGGPIDGLVRGLPPWRDRVSTRNGRAKPRAEGTPYGRPVPKMMVPEAANIPPTPWQTEIFASAICAGAMPRICRTLSCKAYMPYMPECM
jgi:hypothetical protein